MMIIAKKKKKKYFINIKTKQKNFYKYNIFIKFKN